MTGLSPEPIAAARRLRRTSSSGRHVVGHGRCGSAAQAIAGHRTGPLASAKTQMHLRTCRTDTIPPELALERNCPRTVAWCQPRARSVVARAIETRHRFPTSRSGEKGVTRSLVAANSAVGCDRGAGCSTAGARRAMADEERLVPLMIAYQAGRIDAFEALYLALADDVRRFFAASVLEPSAAAISRSRRSSSCTARATPTDRRARCGRGCSGSRSTCGDGIGARRWRGPGARATRRR